MLLLVGILAPSLLLLRPSYKQLVGGGGGRLPLERSVDALLQLPEQGSGLLFQDSKKAMTAQAEHERVLIEPRMNPIVERKRSRKKGGGAKGGGFGAGRSPNFSQPYLRHLRHFSLFIFRHASPVHSSVSRPRRRRARRRA